MSSKSTIFGDAERKTETPNAILISHLGLEEGGMTCKNNLNQINTYLSGSLRWTVIFPQEEYKP